MNKKIIKKIIGEKNIIRAKIFQGYRYLNKFKEFKNTKKIIYMLVPNHGNMGDQAIALATIKYLEDNFSEFNIIEVYREDTYKYINAIKKIIDDKDIIILHGGGNMGNLYPVEERDRRSIIKFFPHNEIISMTQTISFSDDLKGQKELEKTKKIYNDHKNLVLIAREKISYGIMKKTLNIKKILLNPDIVLYLNNMYDSNLDNRNLIMTCLRNDKESVLGKKKIEFINHLNKHYDNIFSYDTVIDRIVTKETREDELKSMLNKFLESKVVITDRLHGMIFAAVTKTPCIVTKSLDHKVTGTYEWIKELNYIRMIDDFCFDKIEKEIELLINLKTFTKVDFDSKYFNKLREKIDV